MKEYRCTNGEVVWAKESKTKPNCIEVLYGNKWYEKDKGILGKTLFPKNDNMVKFGSFLGIKDINSDDEPLFLYVYEPETKLEYRRMGGSYYGATVDVKPVFDDNLKLPDGVETITVNSPIGMAVFGKRSGDTVEVVMPDNLTKKYMIFYVSEEPIQRPSANT